MPTLKERIRGDALLEAISNGKLASILKSFGDAQENGSYGSRMFFIDDDERAETPDALFAQFSLYLTE